MFFNAERAPSAPPPTANDHPLPTGIPDYLIGWEKCYGMGVGSGGQIAMVQFRVGRPKRIRSWAAFNHPRPRGSDRKKHVIVDGPWALRGASFGMDGQMWSEGRR